MQRLHNPIKILVSWNLIKPMKVFQVEAFLDNEKLLARID